MSRLPGTIYVVRDGRAWQAGMLTGDETRGEIKHLAVGTGDATFTDPNQPPVEDEDQHALKGEFARIAYCDKQYVVEDPDGEIHVNGNRYSVTSEKTNLRLYTFRFSNTQATAQVIKEFGYYADFPALRVGGDYGEGGVYDAENNPDGEVSVRGTLVGVKNICDFQKSDTKELESLLLVRTRPTE